MYYTTVYPAPIGQLTLASDGEHLVGLWLAGQKYFGGTIVHQLSPQADLTVFTLAKDWLNQYFAGENPSPAGLPLSPIGTQFQQLVWHLLRKIPYGQVTTYGKIAAAAAEALHRPRMSAQAVCAAVGRNPLSILIPCHRCVGADGSLTGYAGGIQAKLWLLRHEGVQMEALTVPVRGTAL